MGMFRHHTIIVTSGFKDRTKRARRKARRIFGKRLVSKIVETPLNGFWTFFIAPDGSKEMWDVSDQFDGRRAKYVAWLYKQVKGKGYSLFDWVEVVYGDEYGRPSAVISDSTPPMEEMEAGEIPY